MIDTLNAQIDLLEVVIKDIEFVYSGAFNYDADRIHQMICRRRMKLLIELNTLQPGVREITGHIA